MHSTIQPKITTGQIKQGLERIKKAQEQVLQELRRNQISQIQSNNLRESNAMFYKNTSRMYKIKTEEADQMYKQLREQRRKSTEKSQLYGRRIVDLENSLNGHQQNQISLKFQISVLKEQLDRLKYQNSKLEQQNQKLLRESERSQQLGRAQQKKFTNLLKIETLYEQLKAKYVQICSQKESLVGDKAQLLKKYSNLQSQNIRQKQKLNDLQLEINTLLEVNPNTKIDVVTQKISGRSLNILINELYKTNQYHEQIFEKIPKKSAADLLREDNYQTSYNKILEIIESLQNNKDCEITDVVTHHQNADDIKLLQKQIEEGYQKQIRQRKQQNSSLKQHLMKKEKEISLLQSQNKEIQSKLQVLRKQKVEYFKQIQEQTGIIEKLANEKKQKKQNDEKISKNIIRAKQEEYKQIIEQLNEQMNKIKQQKHDLDEIIEKIADRKDGQNLKLKNKIQEMLVINNIIKEQNQGIRSKYDCLCVQKQHLQLKIRQLQNKLDELTSKLSNQLICHSELRKKYDMILAQIKEKQEDLIKHKKMIEQLHSVLEESKQHKQKDREQATRKLMELRKQIQFALAQRQELQGLKIRYDKLLKDNKFLGQIAWQNNTKISHLWQIKEVQYMNVNRILAQMKPSLNQSN